MATTFTTNLGLDKPAVSDTGWGGIRNTNMDDLDSEIVKPRILQSALTWGATTTVDLSLARVFTGTNSQISTIAFSNVPATFPNGAVVPFVRIVLIITNGGAFAITWPASVVWLGIVAPTFRSVGVDIVELVTRDGGTTWYASKMAAPGVLYQNQALTTTATVEGSIASYSLPASALSVNGQAVQITVHGNCITQASALRIRFGATSYVLNIASATSIAAGTAYQAQAIIRRTGAATELASGILWSGATVLTERTSLAEALSGALAIDIRGYVVAGGTLNVDGITIEFLST